MQPEILWACVNPDRIWTMTFRRLLCAASGVSRHALPLLCAGALALSACVPIPYSSGTRYMPNGADLTVPAMDAGGCGFGPDFAAAGYRQFGSVRVTTRIAGDNRTTEDAILRLNIIFEERSSAGKFQSASINSSLVRLEEGGRSYPVASMAERGSPTSSSQTRAGYDLNFPSGTGMDDNIRLVFDDGAIRINGSPVAFGPIRFERRATTSVYLFPCLPS